MGREDYGWLVAVALVGVMVFTGWCSDDHSEEAEAAADRARAAEAAVAQLVVQRDSARTALAEQVQVVFAMQEQYDSLDAENARFRAASDERIENLLARGDSIQNALLVDDSISVMVAEIRAADLAALEEARAQLQAERELREVADERIRLLTTALMDAVELDSLNQGVIDRQATAIVEWRSGYDSMRRARNRERVVSGGVTLALILYAIFG